MTTEQQQIRELAREFAVNEIRPFTAEWDTRREFDSAVFRKLAELGFFGMTIPEEYGGLGLEFGTYLLALEELAWGDGSVALSVAIQNGPAAHFILAVGTDAQRREWLPRLASGDVLLAFALSEEQAGSDLAAIQTRAERTDRGWRIHGHKKWVTNGARAGVTVVFARTGEASRHGGISAFLVDPGAPGYRAGQRERTLGLRASETVAVELDGVEVTEDRLLGRPGAGFYYALRALDVGRVGIATQAVGIAQAAFDHAREYARGREQFGQTIASFEGIQFKLADMALRIASGRALAHEAARWVHREHTNAWDPDAGNGTSRGPSSLTTAAAIAKLAASEAAMWVTTNAVQIFGGYGYMRDYPVEKLMRDAKGTEIYEGTSEVLRLVIAREALRSGFAG
ncbi:MAG: acyl-CoA dehydrogenase family protein [Gemmatimonadetes bacterium]|nr:acyl-CoA dehydrogenase family protein [Gemmatimonadota bacterium]